MNDLVYLHNPPSIPGSDLVILAITVDGTPYAMKKQLVTGSESYDLEYVFSLIPYLTRRAESGEEVPDYGSVIKAIETAKSRARE